MNTRYNLGFHPDIEGDLQKAYSWYEEKLIGLGDDFLQIFYLSIELITENPLQFPKVYKNYHRFLMRKFPYGVYYIIKDKTIIVMGVFHHSRDPKTIKFTLGNRIDKKKLLSIF